MNSTNAASLWQLQNFANQSRKNQMKWVAPSEKDSASATLEKSLWDAADQFRANSGLKPQEYSGPALLHKTPSGQW